MALTRPFLHSLHPVPASLFLSRTRSFPNPNKFIPFSLSMENPPQDYRRNVGICLINRSKKIFAAPGLDIPDAWQMPQGGIDKEEDPRTAVMRELREETGVTAADIVAEVPYWLTYDIPPEVREKLKQQWVQTGKDEEINLSGDGIEKAEFGEWSWLSPQQIVDLEVDFKTPVYQEVSTVFSPYLE